jgi:hypothetical protein
MNIQNQAQKKTTVYRFDVFKGSVDESGVVHKVKSVGAAYVREGLSTYTLHLKTFLKDTFYLLQNTKSPSPDFVILTREPAQNLNRKYFWNNVGEGTILDAENNGIMKLKWDVFSGELYMKIEPISVTEIEEQESPDQAA